MWGVGPRVWEERVEVGGPWMWGVERADWRQLEVVEMAGLQGIESPCSC